MRAVAIILTLVLLAACTTPRPIVDTATKVAKLSDGMDRSITSYVDSLKVARQTDVKRLEGLRSDAQIHKGPNDDQVQIMTIAEESRGLKLLSSLGMQPDADPMALVGDAPAIAASPVSFDTSPLQTVAKISSDIAKPRSASEQLTVLIEFAKTVNSDLQKAADDNKKGSP